MVGLRRIADRCIRLLRRRLHRLPLRLLPRLLLRQTHDFVGGALYQRVSSKFGD